MDTFFSAVVWFCLGYSISATPGVIVFFAERSAGADLLTKLMVAFWFVAVPVTVYGFVG